MRTLPERYFWASATPSDINEHVSTLLSLANSCNRITEFGVRTGVSTTAWLSALANQASGPKILRIYDINRPPDIEEIIDLAIMQGINFQWLQQDTSKLPSIDRTDLLFIDTLHTKAQVEKELTMSQYVSKFIVLHDTELFGWQGESGCGNERTISRGINYAIWDFLCQNNQWRIARHYRNNNGLTVLENSKSGF